jgi:hypothetical protein
MGTHLNAAKRFGAASDRRADRRKLCEQVGPEHRHLINHQNL